MPSFRWLPTPTRRATPGTATCASRVSPARRRRFPTTACSGWHGRSSPTTASPTATVRFWWPAIMGSEVAEFARGRDGCRLRGAAVGRQHPARRGGAPGRRIPERFPGQFRTHTTSRTCWSEIVLSKWFRADMVTDADPVRRVALHDAGARRLLTPEELDRKTAALTGCPVGTTRKQQPAGTSAVPWIPV